MTDYTLNLVDAIISGRATDIETAFQEAITDKISIAMDTRRTEIAQSMFKESAEQLDEISAEKIVKYSEKSNKEYNDPETSDEKKAVRRKGLMTGYNKLKARAKVPATSESLEDYSLEELEDFMMSEDFEQLDEVSKATLGSYVKKASGKLASHGINMVGSLEKSDIANAAYHGTKIDKRQKGISKATDRLTKESFDIEDYSVEELEDFMMSEEFEQLDELSKATLSSYVKKATTNAIISGEALGKGEKWSKSGQIASKREKGIGKAVDKLSK